MKENSKLMKGTEAQYINKWAVICHAAIAIVLFAAYFLEVMKGSRTIVYFLIMALLTLGPVVGEYIVYKKTPESELIRHFIGFGYGIMYVFAIFTTNSLTTFVYVLPIYIVITLFSDVRFCTTVCMCGIGANVVDVAYKAMTTGYTAEELPDVEIRVAVMILTGVFLIITTKVLNRVNTAKVAEINEEKEKTTVLLDSVMDISGRMIRDIEQTAGKMDQLGVSVEEIRNSMQEMSVGTNETAESMQVQLESTGQIQQQIEKVKVASEDISTKITEAGEEVEYGISNMEKLALQAEKSIQANELVVAKMEQLAENTVRMNEIVEMISSVAKHTGLLALNASIESARAGEAGKGFAVVAGEITTLSNQTKEATVDIVEMIQAITEELAEVKEAVAIVSENNRSQAESTKSVTESFEKIAHSTKSINVQAKQMEQVVEQLVAANEGIVESVESVSGTTEEMSAYATQTYQACEENSTLVEEVSNIVRTLSNHAEELKNK